MTVTTADRWPDDDNDDGGLGCHERSKSSNRSDGGCSYATNGGCYPTNDGLLSVSSRSSSSSMAATLPTNSKTTGGAIEGVLRMVASMLAGVGLGKDIDRTSAYSR